MTKLRANEKLFDYTSSFCPLELFNESPLSWLKLEFGLCQLMYARRPSPTLEALKAYAVELSNKLVGGRD